MSILCCPDCRGGLHGNFAEDDVACADCGRTYLMRGQGILDLMPSQSTPLPAAYSDPDYLKMSKLFDEAQSYFTDGNSLFQTIHNASHKKIQNWLREANADGWTCDIGCGQGYHWDFFEGDFDRLIGVDIRLESLKKIRARHKGGILIQADITKLPFKDAVINRIISIYALEHIYFLDDAINEMTRILPPRALAYIGLPCEGGLAWNLGRKLTSERVMSSRYNLDYRKYIRLEHCNNASKVIQSLDRNFRSSRRNLFPFNWLPTTSFNLIVTHLLERR